MAGRSKGSKKTGGRQAGTPNVTNAYVKDMILMALSDKGGWRYLSKQADENPTAFMTLLGKVLPMQITGQDGGPLQTRLEITFVGPDSAPPVR